MAPPTKLTAEVHARIILHIREGACWRHTAATLVGISPRTLEIWCAKGRKELAKANTELERNGELPAYGKWAKFYLSILCAEAEVEMEFVGGIARIARAGEDEGTRLRALIWYLERKNNMRYGSGSQRPDLRGATADADADGDDGATADQDVAPFVLDALRKFKRAIDDAKGRAAESDGE
jgi:hypothetical protein